jgi:hypothetical protein
VATRVERGGAASSGATCGQEPAWRRDVAAGHGRLAAANPIDDTIVVDSRGGLARSAGYATHDAGAVVVFFTV